MTHLTRQSDDGIWTPLIYPLSVDVSQLRNALQPLIMLLLGVAGTVNSGSRRTALHGYRQSAISRHPIGQKFVTPTTGLKVQPTYAGGRSKVLIL
jgi:hypothetical protein